MKFTPITVTAALVGILGAAACFGQTPSPPDSTTSPSSASSPSQRDATQSPTTETPTSQPSDASTPHQREAMGGKNQSMKQCMDAKAAANTSGMSAADMTKACQDQMKMQKDRAHMSKAPDTAPKNSDGYQTPAQK